MTDYSQAVNIEVSADVYKRMSSSNQQDVPQISEELGIHQSEIDKKVKHLASTR